MTGPKDCVVFSYRSIVRREGGSRGRISPRSGLIFSSPSWADPTSAFQALEPAPGELALVQAFLNTEDRLCKVDELTSPKALREWLVHRQLLSSEVTVESADLERARELRESLRTLVLAGTDRKVPANVLARLNQMATSTPVHAVFAPRGADVRLTGARDSVAGALGSIVAAVTISQIREDWGRFKICRSPDCSRAYYDRSRNRSAIWCSTQYCGNRFNAKRTRRRSLR